MPECAVIVLGGDPIPVGARQELPTDYWVIAADSGLDHAIAIGLKVDLLVGDLDSVSSDALAQAEAVPRQVFPVEKAATDFELALDAAMTDNRLDRLIVLGGHGGRIDHLLGNIGVLTHSRLAHLQIEWVAGHTRVLIINEHARLHGKPGDTVSLVPLSDQVEGVTTTGLTWGLNSETLYRQSSRSLSNTLASPVASVAVGKGVLAAIQPSGID